MAAGTDEGRDPKTAEAGGSGPTAPALNLPKGGGAIRGIGEKFGSNPVTGTGAMSVPIATSPGRSGFGPQLSLSYDSGNGNGSFGFGWRLALPSITRKTDKGLPRYDDAAETDVFILSGAEDLVPLLAPDHTRHRDVTTAPGYVVQRYRPRIEGLFARIERWTRERDGDVHWRSITRDNILTIYGKDLESRIAEPEDPRRIFSWLICETRDDKGNATLYEYKPEDGTGVDPARACERNRGDRDDPRRTANRYLKRIRYGNRRPLLDDEGRRPRFLADLPAEASGGWLFEVVFDYGEHDPDTPGSDGDGVWIFREDPFSSWRSGFEVRTTRLCQRVLMFHHIPDPRDSETGYEGLVSSTDFTYSHERHPLSARNPVFTFLQAVHQTGYRRDGDGYTKRSMPPVEMEYTEPVVQDTVERVDRASLENLPAGVDGAQYRWTDLFGEGVPGILTEQGGAWFYKRNLSPATEGRVALAPLEQVALKPNVALAGGHTQFMDLAGDGRLDLVVLDGAVPGFYERDDAEGWQSFRAFVSRLNRDTRDSNLKFVDLDGDGLSDVLIAEDAAFVWHPSLGEKGFGPARHVRQSLDEERGPRLLFADGTHSIYLADLNGDGLTDLVRIRNGEVCYWPNRGYGRFGAKITMDGSPVFDNPDQFDQDRIRLADIDGSGTIDILYLHRDGVRLYFNQSGNGWSRPQTLTIAPRVDELASIAVTDLLGNGTACLVWSSPLPGDRPMRYVNLMGGQKPHLLVRTRNNLGAETVAHYAPSTKFYLRDRQAGRPWTTRLPFPVHVIERMETWDHVSRNRFVSRYAYHDGYFDGEEREFRGFGMVEQSDTEEMAALAGEDALPSNFDVASHVPPVLTKTWFHVGVCRDDGNLLPPGLSLGERREACRALKGSMLRQEIYALDGTPREPHPYTVVAQSFAVRLEQPRGPNRYAVFFTHAHEAITYHHERDPADPRVQHTLTLEVDPFGQVLKEAAIAYARRMTDPILPLDIDRGKQATTLVSYTENGVTNNVDGAGDYRAPLPSESRTYELTGYVPTGMDRFRSADFLQADRTLAFDAEIAYEEQPTSGRQRRLIEHVRTFYRKNDLTGLLPFGVLESLALSGENHKLSFTAGLARQIYVDSGKLTEVDLNTVLADEGRYIHSDGSSGWWITAGRIFLSPDPADTPAQELANARGHFFLPLRYRDPFDTETVVRFDAHDLLLVETRDAIGNRIIAGNDYRVLQPAVVTDPNRNRRAVAFDALGMVVGTAAMGKPEEPAGDSLDGFEPDLSETVVREHLTNPLADPGAILGRAKTRLLHDLFAFQRSGEPMVVYALARETHDTDLRPGETTKFQHSFTYSDGFGREVQKKVQAERGPLMPGGPAVFPRWVGSGWTLFNNKGKPVRQYEPFFSVTHHFEFGVKVGVSSILFYDPVSRVVATLHPNDTYAKVVFTPWRQETWDVNDTVLDDPRTDGDIRGHTAGYFASLPPSPPWRTWYAQRKGGELGTDEQDAAAKAAAHARTPTRTHFDSLGRSFLTLADNGPDPGKPGRHLLFATRVELDLEGNQRSAHDAKETDDGQGRVVMRYVWDMLGNRVHQLSLDAGARWVLIDATGKTIRAWDSRGHALRTEYDPLRRPIRSFVAGGAAPHGEVLTERMLYGEQHPEAETRNLRGTLYVHLDQAGAVTTEARDFKGNVVCGVRRVTSGTQYRQLVNWRAVDDDRPACPPDAAALLDPDALAAALAAILEPDVYVSSTTWDALNRPVAVTPPYREQPSVIRPSYNEAGLLDHIDANLRGATENGAPVWTPFVTNIDYDAKGQRERIEHGNGARTSYEYDPRTFQLVRLVTRRDATHLQDLRYTYDPIGNITRIRDDAQQAIYFDNHRVEAGAAYTYDATYRLVEATGREHLGQVGGAPIPHSHDDALRSRLPHPGDGSAMGTYLERYLYDAVGNFLEMQHRGSATSHTGWTRHFLYDEPNNHLSRTTVGTDDPIVERYAYDAHGNVVRMPHLGGADPGQNMHWDYRDRLQQADLGGGTMYYVYDASGQRVRKVWEKPGNIVEERLYLGRFEIYRRRRGEEHLERETLHIMDDARRVALVETRTVDTAESDSAPPQLIRYQFGNHLGSAVLEVDDRAQIISYEEFTPYGSTSYLAVRSQTETPKRYRFTGKEREEESGFYAQGARYYAPWLGRWISCDALGLVDGTCLYQYAKNEPTNLIDETGNQAGPWTWLVRGRQMEQTVNETVGPILNSAPVQVAAGVSDAIANTVVGVVGGMADRATRTAGFVSRNPAILLLGMTGVAASITISEVDHQVTEVKKKAAEQGGGARGWYVAVNQQFNPAFGIFEHGAAAIEAGRRGDWRAVGSETTSAVVSIAATAAVAAGTAAVAESVLTRVPVRPPGPGAPRSGPSTALVRYDPEFATKQILGDHSPQGHMTPGGRTISPHAAERMVQNSKGRTPISKQQVDLVLDEGDMVRKITPHPQGTTVTVRNTKMPGHPEVIVDAETGRRIVTIVNPTKKPK
jgi:RHS repeat-associated protein